MGTNSSITRDGSITTRARIDDPACPAHGQTGEIVEVRGTAPAYTVEVDGTHHRCAAVTLLHNSGRLEIVSTISATVALLGLARNK